MFGSGKLVMVLAVCLLMTGNAVSQSRLFLDMRGGASIPGPDQTYLRNWGSGWVASMAGAYALNDRLQAVMSVSYNRFGFEGGYLSNGFDHSPVISGDGSTLFQIYGGLRFLPLKGFIRPYITSGIGYQSLHLGRLVRSVSVIQSAPGAYVDSQSDVTMNDGFASAGVGLSLPTPLNIRLLVEGDFAATFDGRHTFVPLTVGIETEL